MLRPEFQVTQDAAAKVTKKRKQQPKSEVSTLRVNPLVWNKAMKLAEGDPSRIVIRSEDEVVVWNKKE